MKLLCKRSPLRRGYAVRLGVKREVEFQKREPHQSLGSVWLWQWTLDNGNTTKRLRPNRDTDPRGHRHAGDLAPAAKTCDCSANPPLDLILPIAILSVQVLECPICLDTFSDPRILTACGHTVSVNHSAACQSGLFAGRSAVLSPS